MNFTNEENCDYVCLKTWIIHLCIEVEKGNAKDYVKRINAENS